MARVVWFTGLSGSGKTTIANALAKSLHTEGKRVEIVDGDVVRQRYHQDLGFTKEDIEKNQRLVIALVKEKAMSADVVLVPVLAPLVALRDEAREAFGESFVEVYVHASHETRVLRDPKGLYKKHIAGELPDFIGYGGVPYEAPTNPNVVIDTDKESVETSIKKLRKFL